MLCSCSGSTLRPGNYIFVAGTIDKPAKFRVGTEEEPFLNRAVITLWGSPVSQCVLPSPRPRMRARARYPEAPCNQLSFGSCRGYFLCRELPLYGSKVLACRKCHLDLHGKPLYEGRTWTKLAATAYRNTRELLLLEPVNWDADSMIAITSTAGDHGRRLHHKS